MLIVRVVVLLYLDTFLKKLAASFVVFIEWHRCLEALRIGLEALLVENGTDLVLRNSFDVKGFVEIGLRFFTRTHIRGA